MKGISSSFWVTTDKFGNYNDLYELLFKSRHHELIKDIPCMSRMEYDIQVNHFGHKDSAISFRHFTRDLLEELYNKSIHEKMNIIVNMIKNLAE
jgi:hypothetical protein